MWIKINRTPRTVILPIASLGLPTAATGVASSDSYARSYFHADADAHAFFYTEPIPTTRVLLRYPKLRPRLTLLNADFSVWGFPFEE